MFHEFNNLSYEIADKQNRFQARAARENLIKTCLEGGRDWQKPGRAERKRPWRLLFRFRFGG